MLVSPIFQSLSRRGGGGNITSTPAWRFIRRIVDSRLLGGAGEESRAAEAGRPDPRIR